MPRILSLLLSLFAFTWHWAACQQLDVSKHAVYVLTAEEFTLQFDSVFVRSSSSEKNKGQLFELALHQDARLENRCLRFSSATHRLLELRIQFVTSLSVQTFAPHCDLLSWKHAISPWKPLALKADSAWVPVFSAEERSAFPEVTLEEVKKQLKKCCGQAWADYVSDAQSVKAAPFLVDISLYKLELLLEEKVSKKQCKKIIHIKRPMGL